MVYLHEDSLSPDPTYGRALEVGADGIGTMVLHPHRLAMSRNECPALKAWAERLDLFTNPGIVAIEPNERGMIDFVFDLGTEVEGVLNLALESDGLLNVYVTFGESAGEAEGLGGYGQGRWNQCKIWHIAGSGVREKSYDPVGFRFARVQIHDAAGPVTLKRLDVTAGFPFERQVGDFRCSDKRLQRVWQTSAYTARICTRADAIWDGIKRDRLGWYGDARVAQLAIDSAFFSPTAAACMVSGVSVDSWANGIPNFSLDAVAMLHSLVLTYGREFERCGECWDRVKSFLAWVEATQTEDGFIVLRADQKYQFGYGFLDWASLPVGGRFEELSWLQCKYLEALNRAGQLAEWFGEPERAAALREQAEVLKEKIFTKFWQDGLGLHHTLNMAADGFARYGSAKDYELTYGAAVRLGPSGPTRHSTALAVWAGLAEGPRREVMLQQGLLNEDLPHVITPMFLYYEMHARATCGDPAGALEFMRDYVGEMLEANDAATVWESYEPDVGDFRRWGLHGWPKSLFHGWGAGIIPLATRWLLGLKVVAPGFSRLRIRPSADVGVAFQATVPTPFGALEVERSEAGGPVVYRVPGGIDVAGKAPAGATVERC